MAWLAVGPSTPVRRGKALGLRWCDVDFERARLSIRQLRHTHATLALEAGIHPKIVSERLGHSTVALTLDIYSHCLQHMQHEAAEQISRLVAGRQNAS